MRIRGFGIFLSLVLVALFSGIGLPQTVADLRKARVLDLKHQSLQTLVPPLPRDFAQISIGLYADPMIIAQKVVHLFRKTFELPAIKGNLTSTHHN